MSPVVFYSPVDPGYVDLGDGWQYMVLPIADDAGQFTIRLVQVDTNGDRPRTGKMWQISREVLPNAALAFARIRTGFEIPCPWDPQELLTKVISEGLILPRVPSAN